MLLLSLAELSDSEVVGISKKPYFGKMPARARFLHPDAASAYRAFPHGVMVISDMFRTPESSLQAVIDQRGAMPPGYSAHNFGLAIDIDVTVVSRNLFKKIDKEQLDHWMEERGWYCHRRDHVRDREEWHYNYLGVGATISPRVKTTMDYIEARIIQLYGPQLELDETGAQECLKKLKLYSGELDGLFGKISKMALSMFQRSVNLADTGKLDARTQRTLAYAACGRSVSRARPVS